MSRVQASGFSLIELMVTIAIVAILAAIAFPSFQSTMRSNRMTTVANEMMASLALARSEALRNPGGAALCSTTVGTACDGTTVGTASTDGWMVWVDSNGDGSFSEADPIATPAIEGDRIVRYVEGRSNVLLTSSVTQVRFDNRGRPEDGAETIRIEPDVCPEGVDLPRVLSISAVGQVKITREKCGE